MSDPDDTQAAIESVLLKLDTNWSVDAFSIFARSLQRLSLDSPDEVFFDAVAIDQEIASKHSIARDAQFYETFATELGITATDFSEYQVTVVPTPTDLCDDSSKAEMSKMIGPYKLLQSIGEGGMGTVYMAEQEKPVRRRVAVKVIKAGMDSKQVIARFEAERQALTMMDHQCIARVLDAGTTSDGRPFFAMELVEGRPINEYCNRNQLPIPERLELFMSVCRAIQHAHQKGIIHRDIKPSNVLVTLYDGRPIPKVIDFGLAKALQQPLTDRTMFTQYGQVVGTLEYMSPEQSELNAFDVDTRTDIYSLGVMLYELLTGSTPLQRDRLRNAAFETILQFIREEEPPRPSVRFSGSGDAVPGISAQRKTDPKILCDLLSGDLDWIAMKALEKDRTRRYDSAGSFARDIERFLAYEPIEARPPTLDYRTRKFVRKHRAALSVLGLVILLLVAGFVGTGTMWYRAEQERGRAVNAETDMRLAKEEAIADRDRAHDAEQVAVAAKEKKEAILARSNFFLAVARWEANRVGEALELLDSIPSEHRHVEWYLAQREFQGSDVTCYGHTGAVLDVAVAPDGKRIASCSEDKTIRIWDAVSGAQLSSFIGHDDVVASVCYSPDGKILGSAGRDNSVRIWDAESGRQIRSFTELEASAECICIDAKGSSIATQLKNGRIHVWDINTGKAMKMPDPEPYEYYHPFVSFTPDSVLFAANKSGSVSFWRPETMLERRLGDGNHEAVTCVALNHDASLVVTGDVWNALSLWDVRAQKKSGILRGHAYWNTTVRDRIRSVEFSPCGRRLASASDDGTVKIWDVASQQELFTLKGHTAEVASAAFTPDGGRIVSSSYDGTVKIWDARSGSPHRNFRGHRGTTSAVEFDNDGTQIASGGWDGTVRLWDLLTGGQVQFYPGHEEFINCLAFSNDGNLLAAGSTGNDVELFDLVNQTLKHTFRGHTDWVECVEFSPNGKRLASCSKDSTIRIWDVENGHELAKLHPNLLTSTPDEFVTVNCISYGVDDSTLCSGHEGGTIKIWNTMTASPVVTMGRKGYGGVSSVHFDARSDSIISSGPGRAIRFWNAETGSAVRAIDTGNASIMNLSVDATQNRAVSANYNDQSIVWDLQGGEEVFKLSGPQDFTNQVALSRKAIAAVGRFGSIWMWDIPDSMEVVRLGGSDPEIGTDRRIASLTFSGDENKVKAKLDDGSALIWDIDTQRILPNQVTDTWSRKAPTRWLAVISHRTLKRQPQRLLLVDRDFKHQPKEQAYRKFKSRIDVHWHIKEANEAEEAKDWFAATFHYAWSLHANHDSSEAYHGLRRTFAGIDDVQTREILLERLPNRVFVILPPKVDVFAIRGIVWLCWRLVLDPECSVEQACEVARTMQVITNTKDTVYERLTWGIALYRGEHFEDAFRTLMPLADLSQVRPRQGADVMDPIAAYAYAVGFTAMSYKKLGKAEHAESARERFQAVCDDEFAKKFELEKFREEVISLFAKIAPEE